MTESEPIHATILNTRPAALQQYTHEAFVKQGFKVIDFPCIEIVDVKNTETVIFQLDQINTSDVIIFTSQYAVRYAFKLNPKLNLPNKTVVIAVGTKTSQVLEQNYSGGIWIPEQQNSEGVIDLIKGLANCESIKLISAENGRKLIQLYAQDHTIKFEQINVYQRQLPTVNTQTIQTLAQTSFLYILVTSVTTLNNLKALIESTWPELLKQSVICASSRIQEAAKKLGFNNTLNCQTANPELIAEQLKNLIASKHN